MNIASTSSNSFSTQKNFITPEIKITLIRRGAVMPKKILIKSIGFELFARRRQKIGPHSSLVINTGIVLHLPPSYYAILLPPPITKRSKSPIIFPQSVHSGYQEELKVIVYNFGNKKNNIRQNQRIARLIIHKFHPHLFMRETRTLDLSSRDRGGFG